MDESERRELLHLGSVWRHDGLAPLAVIAGWADLLLAGDFGTLNEEQKQGIQFIRKACMRATEQWHHNLTYLELHYGEEAALEQVALPGVISSTLHTLQTYYAIEEVQVSIPDNVPNVRGHRPWLATAITDLILLLHDHKQDDFIPSIRISEMGACKWLVNILAHSTLRDIRDLPSHPHSRLGIARHIIRRHGSEIVMGFSGDLLEFHFTLAAWDEHPAT